MSAGATIDAEKYEARLTTVYDESGHASAIYLEWRHKVILLCSATNALAFASASWSYRQDATEAVIATPLILAAVVMALCAKFDRRNGFLITDASYGVAQECELALGEPPGSLDDVPVGVWTRIDTARGLPLPYMPPRRPYPRMPRLTYQLAGLLLLAGAVVVIAAGPVGDDEVDQVSVRLATGTTICGTPLNTVPGQVAVAAQHGGEIHTYPIGMVDTYEVGGC